MCWLINILRDFCTLNLRVYNLGRAIVDLNSFLIGQCGGSIAYFAIGDIVELLESVFEFVDNAAHSALLRCIDCSH